VAKDTHQKPTEPTAEEGVFAVLVDGYVLLIYNAARQALNDWHFRHPSPSNQRLDTKAEFYFYDVEREAVRRIEETDARYALSRNRIVVDLEHQRNLIAHALDAFNTFKARPDFSHNTMDEATPKTEFFISHASAYRTKEQTTDEIIARATDVIGSREDAMRWLGKPVRGLNFATPISLLATPEGVKRVSDILGQMEHGVW
jgi:hypothetical protein